MTTENKPTLTTVLGGVMFTVHFLDGSTADVKIRQLNVRQLTTDWLKVHGNDPAAVELYCEKPEGWADTVTIDDFNEILRIGDELNDPQFARWADRRRAEIAKMKEYSGIVNPLPAPPENSSTSPSSSSPSA